MPAIHTELVLVVECSSSILFLVLMLTLTYVDGYLQLAGEANGYVNVLKNSVAFCMSYGAIPWLLKCGWERVWGAATGVCGVVILSSIPVYLFARAARRMTVEWRFVKVYMILCIYIYWALG